MLISFSRFSFTLNRPLMMLPLLIPACALANNGLNLSGYGARSEAMGGADVAVATDTFAVNSNPAGLTQTQGEMLDMYAGIFATDNTHSDGNGNFRKNGHTPFGGWGAGGYARRLEDTPLTFGVGLFIQGGSGYSYKNLNTPFSNAGVGPRDEVTATFSVIKLAPAIAWKLNDQWSTGVALAINYASAAQTLFPNTSALTPFPFTGLNFEDASGIGITSRLGVQYRPAEDVTFGVAYGTPANISLKGGNMRVNYSAMGAGIVRYENAELQGFKLPQDVSFGVSFRPIKPLLVSLQEIWYDWSAVKDFTLVAKNPNSSNPVVQRAIVINSPVYLNDQHVYSIGLAYDYSAATTLMAGVNYARRALPDKNLSPVFALIQAPHYMLGASHQIDKAWSATGVLEFVMPRQMVTNPSTNPLFGTNTTETQQGIVMHLMASHRW